MMLTAFSQLPVGARFEFRGRRYEKLALSLARDEERCGNIFQDHTEVLWDLRTAPGPRRSCGSLPIPPVRPPAPRRAFP